MAEEHTHEHAQPPDPMTEPCSRFFRDYSQLMHFVGFIATLAQSMDEISIILRDKPEDLASEEGNVQDVGGGAGAVKTLQSRRKLLKQMMLCRAVDNYLAYVSEIMALIFTTKPETLKSEETIKLDVLLQHETMDDLISTLAERRVERLSYQGMGDLAAYLFERLGFSLFEQDDALERAVRIVEIRNLIVHNRAVVNRRFASRLPDSPAKLGETLEITAYGVLDDLEFLAQSCSEIDERAASKFDLPRPISRESLISPAAEA